MQVRTRTDMLLPVAPRRQREHREPGLHLSAIIKDLCVRMDPERFDKQRGGRDAAEVVDLETVPKIWLGQAMDYYLGTVLAKQRQDGKAPKAIRPGGIPRDGIWMTSDLLVLSEEPARPGLSLDTDEESMVEEWKLTWMSNSQGITDAKFRHWLWQLKGYCYAWETLRGRIRAFHVNGDYKWLYRKKGQPDPPQVHYLVHEFVFTYQDLTENWAMLQNHARRYMNYEG